MAYHDEKGLPVVVVRFFNTVGPRQSSRYGMVIPSFVERALKGEPLLVYGDGEQSRCFTYVKDAVRAVAELMEAGGKAGREAGGGGGVEGEVFNIGREEEITIRALAERVVELTGSESEIRHVAYAEVFGEGFEDMRRRTPDVSKLERAIGFRAEHSTEEILQKTIDYFREQLQIGAAENGTPGRTGSSKEVNTFDALHDDALTQRRIC